MSPCYWTRGDRVRKLMSGADLNQRNPLSLNKFEDTFADPSFQHTNLNMSQMFNYYSNYPTKEFLKVRILSKLLLTLSRTALVITRGRRTIVGSSARTFSMPIALIHQTLWIRGVKARWKISILLFCCKLLMYHICFNQIQRKSKNIANILDVPLVKHSKSSNKNKVKNGGKSNTHAKVLASIKDWT